MSRPVIEVHHLAKRYHLGAIGTTSLREEASRLWDRLRGVPHPDAQEFWALRDVSFEVQPGEVVGVIGRNGAGKSTLLKILSRITEPTSGQARLRGRVASLLEVGTGFHPELTGRENVFLNGAILGMTRAEVRRKFDEIVAFAEVAQFIDTPVKRYSSGMYVRLAFAVAAHLEPEILIVDEVLAVGDANFQKKCLGKMGTAAREGRAVLFVSHNMHAVSLLCTTAVLMQHGQVADTGVPGKVIANYLSNHAPQQAAVSWDFADAPGSSYVKLHSVRALNPAGEVSPHMHIDEPVRLEMEFWILRLTTMTPSFHIYNNEGILLFAVSDMHDSVSATPNYPPGLHRLHCTIPANYLNEGEHYVTIFLTRDNNAGLTDVHRPEVVSFSIHDRGTHRAGYVGKWIGLVRPLLPWTGSRVADLPAAQPAPGNELHP